MYDTKFVIFILRLDNELIVIIFNICKHKIEKIQSEMLLKLKIQLGLEDILRKKISLGCAWHIRWLKCSKKNLWFFAKEHNLLNRKWRTNGSPQKNEIYSFAEDEPTVHREWTTIARSRKMNLWFIAKEKFDHSRITNLWFIVKKQKLLDFIAKEQNLLNRESWTWKV